MGRMAVRSLFKNRNCSVHLRKKRFWSVHFQKADFSPYIICASCVEREGDSEWLLTILYLPSDFLS